MIFQGNWSIEITKRIHVEYHINAVLMLGRPIIMFNWRLFDFKGAVIGYPHIILIN